MSVGFDLIVIDSMDDVEPFSVDIDGSTEFGPVFFINRIGGPTDSSDPGATGAPISLDTHMFTPVNSLSRSDAVYRIEFDATHSASTLMADFSYTGLQAINDEAWSIDNIQIEIDAVIVDPPTPSVPAPSTLALLGLGLIGVATARRRRVAIR